MSRLTAILDSATHRYLVVDALLYRLRSVVTTADLAAVGHAYVVGLREALRVVSAREEETERGAALAAGATPEQAEAAVRRLQAQRTRDALEAHAAAMRDPAQAAAYVARTRAFACASVVGIGPAPSPVQRALEGWPGVELMPHGWEPPPDTVEPVQLVDEEPPAVDMQTARLVELGDAGQIPLWALDPHAVEAIAQQAWRLAGGRSAAVAPFRAGARPADRDRPDRAPVPRRPVDGDELATGAGGGGGAVPPGPG